jgi:hypothetical protein
MQEMNYHGFESKQSAVIYAIKALRENKLVTKQAEKYYDQYIWDHMEDRDKEDDVFDLDTWTSEEDEMYYRLTTSKNTLGWSVEITLVNIPTPDPEMAWYDDSFYCHHNY